MFDALSVEMLSDLRALLESWNIPPEDWYVTGEAAMLLSGYPVDYREGQMDVLVCRSSWPWNREEEQVSLFPDKGTIEDAQLNEFIAKHKMMPDFHPLPHVGLKAEDRFEHAYWHPDESGVRVLKPWAGIYHRKCIVNFYMHEHPKGLDVFDRSKFERWKKFIEQTKDNASGLGDAEAVAMCNEVLPIVQKAIDYFDAKQSAEQTSLSTVKGTSAFEGKATGIVQHWLEGADFSGKIVVLEHLLPSQVTFIKDAAAIITDQGGLLSHAATVAREYRIPTIIGTRNSTSLLCDGDVVEVDSALGTVKRI
ncbi:MAG: PEP-utilizing enzyme [Patescibacteria group bacterium]